MTMSLRQVLGEAPSVASDLFENYVTHHFRVLAPTVLQVNVNLRCNTKCSMCGIWELKLRDQLSVEQYDQIFADPVYRRVEYIILAGGEPTLRPDLPEVVEVMHKHMPKTKKLMVASNVIAYRAVEKQYPRIAAYCAEHGIRLTLGVSLDGVGDLHDEVRGVKGAFENVMRSIHFMKDLQKRVPFNMSIDPTIFSMNIHEMQKLKDFAEELGLPITFQFAAVAEDYYSNSGIEDVLSLNGDGKRSLIRFLRQHIAESAFLDALAYYYEKVAEQAERPQDRNLPCPFQNQGLMLNPDGSLQYCHNSSSIGSALEKGSGEIYHDPENLRFRKEVVKNRCPTCRMSCMYFVSLRKEVFPFLWFITKRFLKGHRRAVRRAEQRAERRRAR
jgi:MoaA/NifB/PqqE/SkfB family radical SAM enzyme